MSNINYNDNNRTFQISIEIIAERKNGNNRQIVAIRNIINVLKKMGIYT
jgi:hypothetical protein